jgi:U3 small nucleolar RNA-associated protein 10
VAPRFLQARQVALLVRAVLQPIPVGGAGGLRAAGAACAELRTALLRHLEASVLFAAVRTVAGECVLRVAGGGGPGATSVACIRLLRDLVEGARREALVPLHVEVFKLLLQSADAHVSAAEHKQIGGLEQSLCQAMLGLTLKLSDDLFRPLWAVLIDWARRKEGGAQRFTLRLVVEHLVPRLRGLFVPYHVELLPLMLEGMGRVAAGAGGDGATALVDWTLLVRSLTALCEQDAEHRLVDGEQRRSIAAALLAHLGPVPEGVAGAEEAHAAAITTAKGPAALPWLLSAATAAAGEGSSDAPAAELLLAALGAAVREGGQACWRAVHGALLLRTRAPDVRVRVLACAGLRRVWETVGEELLPLFPESLPFLAELLEDGDGLVEREAQRLCLAIQQFLGEDISTYFSQ